MMVFQQSVTSLSAFLQVRLSPYFFCPVVSFLLVAAHSISGRPPAEIACWAGFAAVVAYRLSGPVYPDLYFAGPCFVGLYSADLYFVYSCLYPVCSDLSFGLYYFYRHRLAAFSSFVQHKKDCT